MHLSQTEEMYCPMKYKKQMVHLRESKTKSIKAPQFGPILSLNRGRPHPCDREFISVIVRHAFSL